MNLRAIATRLAPLATVVALAGLVGCTGDVDPPGDPVVAAGCDPPEEQQLQEGSHLLGDQAPPVPYTSSPPTSGWHSSGRPLDPGAYTEPVSEPQQVRVLEQGGVVLAYDPSLPDGDVGQLQRIAGEVDGVVVTPYEPAMPTPVTLTAWGVLQRCDTVTAADVAAFRDAHAPAPGH